MSDSSPSQFIKTKGGTEAYTDPRQVRYVECGRMIRELRAEMSEIKRAMEFTKCEICGKEFRRSRITRRYCGPLCVSAAFLARGNNGYDVAAIREALPLLKAGRMMSFRSLEIVERFLNRDGAVNRVAEDVDLTRQRVQQIIAQANRVAKIALAMKAAVLANTPQEVSR